MFMPPLWRVEGGNFVKRVVYLATTALLAMLILVPSALAQDVLPGDDDPFLPEQNVTVVEEAQLEQIAGQPLPSEPPTVEPVPVTGQPSDSAPLPKTGGPETDSSTWAMVLSASALLLLLGLGSLAYGVSRRR
jgi:hypothetical protein